MALDLDELKRLPKEKRVRSLGDFSASIFPNNQAFIKQVYLAVEEAGKKRAFRHREWVMIYSQLMIYFGDRLGERA